MLVTSLHNRQEKMAGFPRMAGYLGMLSMTAHPTNGSTRLVPAWSAAAITATRPRRTSSPLADAVAGKRPLLEPEVTHPTQEARIKWVGSQRYHGVNATGRAERCPFGRAHPFNHVRSGERRQATEAAVRSACPRPGCSRSVHGRHADRSWLQPPWPRPLPAHKPFGPVPVPSWWRNALAWERWACSRRGQSRLRPGALTQVLDAYPSRCLTRAALVRTAVRVRNNQRTAGSAHHVGR